MRQFQVTDLAEMNGWLRERGQSEYSVEALSAFGLFVPGVAVGFLYATDSSICLLEGYVTNPRAEADDRHQALEAITTGLITKAKERGSQHVVALVRSFDITQRARAHGFNRVPEQVWTKDLR